MEGRWEASANGAEGIPIVTVLQRCPARRGVSGGDRRRWTWGVARSLSVCAQGCENPNRCARRAARITIGDRAGRNGSVQGWRQGETDPFRGARRARRIREGLPADRSGSQQGCGQGKKNRSARKELTFDFFFGDRRTVAMGLREVVRFR